MDYFDIRIAVKAVQWQAKISFNGFVIASVTRWLDYCFDIWPFARMNFCATPFFAKVGSKFC